MKLEVPWKGKPRKVAFGNHSPWFLLFFLSGRIALNMRYETEVLSKDFWNSISLHRTASMRNDITIFELGFSTGMYHLSNVNNGGETETCQFKMSFTIPPWSLRKFDFSCLNSWQNYADLVLVSSRKTILQSSFISETSQGTSLN